MTRSHTRTALPDSAVIVRALTISAALSASCYSTQEMKVHLDVWPHTPTNCFGAADQVFFDAFGLFLVSYSAGVGWVILAPSCAPCRTGRMGTASTTQSRA